MTARAQVPDEGELRLGSVQLPAGRLLRLGDGRDEPVGWITEAAVPEAGALWSAPVLGSRTFVHLEFAGSKPLFLMAE